MPRSIVWFERTAYFALILGIVSVALNWPTSIRPAGATPIKLVLIQAFSIALQVTFIWLIARRRKNWARWIWLIVVFGGTVAAIALEVSRPTQQNGTIGSIAFYGVYLAFLVSGIFLLAPTVGAWLDMAKQRDDSKKLLIE